MRVVGSLGAEEASAQAPEILTDASTGVGDPLAQFESEAEPSSSPINVQPRVSTTAGISVPDIRSTSPKAAEPTVSDSPKAAEPAVSEAPATAGVPLSYLLSAQVGFEWHDVVAVVQELGDQLKDSKPSRSLLALDAITLQPDGRLRVRLDTGTLPIVLSLGQVLSQLLSNQPTPANLRLIAMESNSETSTLVSVEDLTSALAKFERPGRRKALAALYERARRATPPVRPLPVPATLERPPKTPLPLILPAKRESQTDAQPPRAPWRPPNAVFIVGTVCIALIGRVFVIRERPQPVTAPPPVVEQLPAATGDVPEGVPEQDTTRTSPLTLESAVRATRSPARVLRPALPERAGATGGSEVPRIPKTEVPRIPKTVVALPQPATLQIPAGAEGEFRLARAQFDRKEYAAAADGFQRVIAILSHGELSLPSSTLRSTATEMAALSRAALLSTSDARVYTRLDRDVTAPVPLRHYFPEEPALGVAPSDASVLELLIDNRGAVESVHLLDPQNRYRDKWWLPAAKTWRFQPAVKDGQPVKFLKRIRITPNFAPLSPSDPQ